ncbi:DUF1476 domain-containing protein [uncultured Maricaulis sp.]|uniref:DUF1476 domain-containing protein n=1 Tax=uncultured Maricaulis sp. TaxID=174710 RepID=UPI0030D7D8B0
MSGINDREKGFENKFAHEQENEFKATARRNKLLGLWAAGLMGIDGAEADAYAKSVVIADFEEAGDEDVFRKVRADLDAKNVELSDHLLRKQMDDLMETALEQIRSGS